MVSAQILSDEGITVRTLPPEEAHRVTEAQGPMANHPDPMVLKDSTRIVVLEKAGEIVGYWVMFDTVHIEPLWLDPETRNHPKAAMALLSQVYTELQGAGVRQVFAVIGDRDAEVMGPMAEQIGLSKIQGALFGGFVPPKG